VSVWFQYSHILFIAKRFSFGAFRRFFGLRVLLLGIVLFYFSQKARFSQKLGFRFGFCFLLSFSSRNHIPFGV